jgi:hypothetical protein
MKAYKTTRGQAVSDHKRRKHKELDNNIDSVAHNQTLKQQKPPSGRIPHTNQ